MHPIHYAKMHKILRTNQHCTHMNHHSERYSKLRLTFCQFGSEAVLLFTIRKRHHYSIGTVSFKYNS